MENKTVKVYLEGIWYHCYGDDALVVSYITGYKVYEDSIKECKAVGFKLPSKVIRRLKAFEINYDFEGFNNKQTFENNKYDEVLNKYLKEKERVSKLPKLNLTYKKEKKEDNENNILLKGNVVKPNKSVTLRNIDTNERETFNIIELNYHFEPRYGDNKDFFRQGHIVTTKIYDKKIDIDNNEISSESEFYKEMKNHRIGYSFTFRDISYEIIDIRDYIR